MIIWLLILLVILSYLFGNINFARILSGVKKEDITKFGSGNPGATSMLRRYGFKYGLLTFILDAIKGAIPALVGLLVFGGINGGVESLIGLYSMGLACVIGHVYPVFYKFKGGKGISSTLGVFAVADPLVMLIIFVLAFLFVIFFEYMSLASLLVTTVLTIIEVNRIPEGTDETLGMIVRLLIFTIFVLTWWAHRANIIRLLVGKENKANLKQSLKKLAKKQKKEQKMQNKQA